MTKKQIVRCIAFFLIVCLMLVAMCDLFELKNTTNYDKRLCGYKKFNENTIDAIYIGTSGVDRYWNPANAYEKYGMTVANYSVDGMLTALYINAIEDASIKQDIKLVLVDARAYGHTYTVADTDVCARRQMDAITYLSPTWFATVKKTIETMKKLGDCDNQRILSYYVPFVKYHTKWADEEFLISESIGGRPHKYAGFFVNSSLSAKVSKQEPVKYDTKVRKPLDKIAEESLYELIDYAKEKDIKLLFVDTPQFMDEQEMARANTLADILEEKGETYLNFNLPEVQEKCGLKMNPEKDYYNNSHTNFYGAERFTKSLAKYLNENYQLPDRRKDENAKENWDGIYDSILKEIKKIEKKVAKKAAEKAAKEE